MLHTYIYVTTHSTLSEPEKHKAEATTMKANMCGILAVATAAAERRENNLASYLFRAISIFYFVFFFSIRFFFSRARVG